MKTNTAYIFISILGACVEMQAPAKKTFSGTVAKVSQASAFFAKGDHTDEAVEPIALSLIHI